jgi:hypothetical protein
MDEISNPSDPADSSGPADASENTRQNERGRAFEGGNTGNLPGPKRSRNKRTMAVEALLDGEATAITCKVIEKALGGDMTALRLCFERILPAKRDHPVGFEMPEIKTAGDAVKASSALLAACAAGTLSRSEAAEIMALVVAHIQLIEQVEIEARITALEKVHSQKERQP